MVSTRYILLPWALPWAQPAVNYICVTLSRLNSSEALCPLSDGNNVDLAGWL